LIFVLSLASAFRAHKTN